MLYNSYNIYSLIGILLAAVISITLHEFSHGLVALWNGDYTAKYNGRLTLNPIKHFDLMGFIMLMVAGFGFAKPVPVNYNNFKKRKTGIFTVAIAGVSVNILLAFISAPLFILFNNMYSGLNNAFAEGLTLIITHFFFYMITINISLFLFNLLPLYPLDGFRVVEAFTRYINPVTKFLRDYGRYILLALIFVSIIIDIFDLKSVSAVFEYVDLIGLYIGKLGGFIVNGFIKLWQLIIL